MCRLLWLGLAAMVSGCASDPLRAVADQVLTVSGAGFHHRVVRPPPPRPAGPDTVLHLYIPGDGRAFIDPRTVASDPTPRNLVALELMLRDPNERALLGRPCYFGLASQPECSPEIWTSARYSDPVVTSMVAAKRALWGERPILLIGYSGGGTIAMLMAARLPETVGVLTVAGNLDVAAWTRLHGFTPLADSLDPARAAALPDGIRQWHLAGGRDENVPPSLVKNRVPAGTFCEIPGFRHECCWPKLWPAALSRFRGTRTPGPDGAAARQSCDRLTRALERPPERGQGHATD